MQRREFIGLLGGAAAAWPLAARAQQPLPLIGYLGPTSPQTMASRLQAFHRGLAETGYVEGRNLLIEYRWAENQTNRFPALAAELIRRKPAVIVAPGGAAGALAAKAATTSIPIVFETGADPVALGLVPGLSHPGGNVTGITSLNNEVGPKRLELLREMLPNASALGLLVDPTSATVTSTLRNAQMAAQTLGVELNVLNARSELEINAAFSALTTLPARGLAIATTPYFASRVEQLAELALRHAVPTVFFTREFAAAGGLMSYGGSITESHRLAGVYAGRILKGDKPADLPVQQVTKVELIINMKTAKALGLTFPLTLLGRADEVIE
jgi:putative tryptophan/tyrosine transport system substrate-binding protein